MPQTRPIMYGHGPGGDSGESPTEAPRLRTLSILANLRVIACRKSGIDWAFLTRNC